MLIWDDVDVDNDIEMTWDDVDNDIEMMMLMLMMSLWWCMLCMYMEDAVTMLDILGGGNRVFKEF